MNATGNSSKGPKVMCEQACARLRHAAIEIGLLLSLLASAASAQQIPFQALGGECGCLEGEGVFAVLVDAAPTRDWLEGDEWRGIAKDAALVLVPQLNRNSGQYVGVGGRVADYIVVEGERTAYVVSRASSIATAEGDDEGIVSVRSGDVVIVSGIARPAGVGISEVLAATPGSPEGLFALLTFEGVKWVAEGRSVTTSGARWRQEIAADAGEIPVKFCGVGDVNGDGIGDLAVGLSRSKFLLYCGAGGKELGTARVSPPGLGDADWHGCQIAGMCEAGDVDGDGVGDFALACSDGGWGKPRLGWFEVRSGSDCKLIWQAASPVEPWVTLESECEVGTFYGDSICLGVDQNGDGVRDLVVGSIPGRSVRLVSGSSGEELWTRTALDVDGFGTSLALVCDQNGDGIEDIGVLACPVLCCKKGHESGVIAILDGKSGVMLRVAAVSTLIAMGQ